jgi:hypothetical protein
MKVVRLSLLAGLMLLLAAGEEAGTVRGARAPKVHAFHGTVSKVRRGEGKSGSHHGTITVEHRIGKGKNGQGTYTEKTFRVTAGTHHKRVTGGKGQKETTKAKFEDVERGQHVTIYHLGEHAREVHIHAKKSKKQ